MVKGNGTTTTIRIMKIIAIRITKKDIQDGSQEEIIEIWIRIIATEEEEAQ